MAIDQDLELMLLVRKGDTESFEVLLRRYRAPLVNFFVRMVQDRALAEDLAQEVFLRVYQARHRYQPDARFTTWLYRIATNLALNAIRDRKGSVASIEFDEQGNESKVARVADGKPVADQQMMQSDRERIIREAVEALPEKQCTAVILHKYQDVNYRQISKVLGVSESAVKSLLFRAYESLRERLEPLMKEGQL